TSLLAVGALQTPALLLNGGNRRLLSRDRQIGEPDGHRLTKVLPCLSLRLLWILADDGVEDRLVLVHHFLLALGRLQGRMLEALDQTPQESQLLGQVPVPGRFPNAVVKRVVELDQATDVVLLAGRAGFGHDVL